MTFKFQGSVKTVPYDVELSFFGGKPVKAGSWPSRVDEEGMEHVKSLANRAKRLLQDANRLAVMGGDFQFQKKDYNALDIAFGDASSFKKPEEPTSTPKKKKSVKRKLFIEDEAEDDRPSEVDNEGDNEDFKATEEDIKFIDDLIATDENDWSQYLNK